VLRRKFQDGVLFLRFLAFVDFWCRSTARSLVRKIPMGRDPRIDGIQSLTDRSCGSNVLPPEAVPQVVMDTGHLGSP
jgi:hypothetical protein